MVEIELTRAVVLGIVVGFLSLLFPVVARFADVMERTQRLFDLVSIVLFFLGLFGALIAGNLSIQEFSESGIAYLVGLLADYLVGLVIGVLAGAVVAIVLSPFRR